MVEEFCTCPMARNSRAISWLTMCKGLECSTPEMGRGLPETGSIIGKWDDLFLTSMIFMIFY